MRSVGPVALLGGAAALAMVGVGLLLPGGARDGAAGPSVAVAATVPVPPAGPAAQPRGEVDAGARDLDAVALDPTRPTASAGSPGRAAPPGRPPGASPAPVPLDRLAGPVPDDEIARAFADAVPAADGLDPAAGAQIAGIARTGLVDWYAGAGWQGVTIQAVVVTAVAPAPAAPASEVITASVAALWSGQHPVLGASDRRYATVTLTTTGETGGASTVGGPGSTWTVESIEGGARDG